MNTAHCSCRRFDLRETVQRKSLRLGLGRTRDIDSAIGNDHWLLVMRWIQVCEAFANAWLVF